MKHAKKIGTILLILILIIIAGGCFVMDIKQKERNEDIKKNFAKTLKLYPIKNLEELYDKEGYRDNNFKPQDKGVWVLHTHVSIQPKNKDLESRGLVLFLDRNTRTSTGKFYINKYSSYGNQKKYYPIELKNNKVQLKNKNEDEEIKKEVENFKLFSQYANFKDIDKYPEPAISFNPNVPSYQITYDLDNSDDNTK